MLLNALVALSAWGKGAKMAHIEDCMDEQREGARTRFDDEQVKGMLIICTRTWSSVWSTSRVAE
jgi:hypothetical protein